MSATVATSRTPAAAFVDRDTITRYYREHFPAQSLVDWLNGVGKQHTKEAEGLSLPPAPPAFGEFEFALFKRPTPASESMMPIDRHAYFDTAEQFRDTLINTGTERVEIGAQTDLGRPGLVRNLLVFDLDAEEYEAVWPYAGSTKDRLADHNILTPQAWDMLVQSMRLLQLFLELNVMVGDLGKDLHYLAVFSGRRGAHLYLLGRFRDELLRAQMQTRIIAPLASLQTAQGAFHFLRQLCQVSTRTVGQYTVQQVLQEVLVYAKAALSSHDFWQHQAALKPPQNDAFYRLVCEVVSGAPELAMRFVTLVKQPQAQADFFAELAAQGDEAYRGHWLVLGLALLAPRVDKNVSTGRLHLLKAPFSVHPNTGIVSTPFDLWKREIQERWPGNQIVDLRELYHHREEKVRRHVMERLLQTIAFFESITARL
jgi:DNA primase catalytic subunit